MNRHLKLFLFLTLASVLVIGCAPPGTNTPTPESKTEPADEDHDKTDGKTKITWIQWWKSEVGEEPLNKIKETFEAKYDDIELEIIDLPYAQVHDKIVTLDMAGNPPDILTVQAPWYIEFAEAGITKPLNDFVDEMGEEYKKEIEGPLWTAWKDQFYGMPFYTGTVALFYNKDKLDAADVSPPTNWQEFIEASKKLTDTEGKQFAMTGNIGAEPATTATYEIWPLILQAGGKIIENNRAAFNTPEGVKALEFYKSLLKEHKVSTPGELSAGEKEKRANFSAENTAFMFEGPWGIGIQKQANPNLNYDIVPNLTDETHGTIVAGSLLSLSSKSKNEDAAWKFISFMGSIEGQLLWAHNANYFPHNNKAMEDPSIQDDSRLKVFADAFKQGNALAVDMYLPQSNDLRKVFMIEVQNFVSDKKSAQEALDDAAAKWDEVMSSYD